MKTLNTKNKFSYLIGLAFMMTIAQGCAPQNFTSPTNATNIAGSSKSEAESCDITNAPEYIKFIDQQAADSKVYSAVQVSGLYGEETLYTIPVNGLWLNFQAFGNPDFVVSDSQTKYNGFTNVPVGSSGILNSVLGKLGMDATAAQKITYCQARSICNEVFKTRKDWKKFSCSLQQVEFDNGGYVSIFGYVGPNPHMRASKLFSLFNASIGLGGMVSCTTPTVGGLYEAAPRAYRGAASCTTEAELNQMIQDGFLTFKY